MAGIRGENEGDETVLDHLCGYAGSRPVRVGNAAFTQTQWDTYGHVLDAALSYHEMTGALGAEEWGALRGYVETMADAWREADHGIWEVRGPKRHFVNSKVMAWVCLDRGIRLAELLADDDAPVHRWRRAADELRQQVLERGFDSRRNAFVMAYDWPVLDASLLRIPLVGFLPGDDPRVVGTIDAVRTHLAADDVLVHRYDSGEVDDGLPGKEGAFLLCSFELVSVLVLAGRTDEAAARFHRLCRRSGPLGLFSEEAAPDGTALGNYPQAFTHLALIEAAVNLDAAGSSEELHRWAAGPDGRD